MLVPRRRKEVALNLLSAPLTVPPQAFPTARRTTSPITHGFYACTYQRRARTQGGICPTPPIFRSPSQLHPTQNASLNEWFS